VPVRALLTDMNTPLGRACGNWLEVQESVACLEGCGPDDLRALVIECAAHLLAQTGQDKNEAAGRARAASCLDSGRPREKWNEMLQAQGADLAAFEHELLAANANSAHDENARDGTATTEVCAAEAGFVSRCDARIVGEVVRDLGGGRQYKNSTLDWRVGVSALAKPGERVAGGGVLCRIHARNAAEAETARARLRQAIESSDEAPRESALIIEVVE
jgi:pyrimidine-nucleoside phosphorylase